MSMTTKRPKNLSGALVALEEMRKKTGASKETVDDVAGKIAQKDLVTSQVTINADKQDIIARINPNKVFRWKYKDRPDNELGDIAHLAEEFKKIGQQQPCVVRPILNNKDNYELIIGERRWKAAVKANMDLLVIIRTQTDNEAALSQIAENDDREDISDYAKGTSYSKLIDDGVISQKDLIEKLGKSKQYVSSLLSFSKIPHAIISAIDDMSKVSAKTAEAIKQLSNKGQSYIDAIIELAPAISKGSIGHSKLTQKVDLKTNNIQKNHAEQNKKVLSPDGRHIFTWRQDNNLLPSIHFPKGIIDLITSNEINIDQLTQRFKEVLEDELLKLKK